MSKIKSFDLPKNMRIGNYRVLEKIARGCEGEVYKVEEVPTEAVRALKLFRNSEFHSNLRTFTHIAWSYEQLITSGHSLIYHHYGQIFLDDDRGATYLVFDYVDGKTIKDSPKTEKLFFDLVLAMASFHHLGYAVGDMGSLTNAMVRKIDNKVIIVDFEYGKPDKPNLNFKNDCITEIPKVAKAMFSANKPPAVKSFLKELKAEKKITNKTLIKIIGSKIRRALIS